MYISIRDIQDELNSQTDCFVDKTYMNELA